MPLVAVPSTYSKVYEKDLIKYGFKMVIYANQLLRAAYPYMLKTAQVILKKIAERLKQTKNYSN